MTRAPWIRGPLWDTALLSFPWVPLYLWFVIGLRLGDGGGEVVLLDQRFPALTLAILVVLGITFVHRHYTFVLVYGDAGTFAARARAYVLVPVALFALLAVIRASSVDVLDRGGMHVGFWELALASSGTWNVWHTVQQRYGILRVYAGKAGHGLEGASHARRDQRLVWSLVLAVALALLEFRRHAFLGHDVARRTLIALLPIIDTTAFDLLAGVLALGVIVMVASWVRAELAMTLPLRERVPRLTFLASSLALLSVFVLHGPIVGYLTFGAAHALEYIAFVHHFGERKFDALPEVQSVAARLLRRPALAAPLLGGVLLAAYVLLQPIADSDAFLVYYVGSSMLHFLYDGWIWKVRKPEVALPLGAATA